jgi:hypothetical protein
MNTNIKRSDGKSSDVSNLMSRLGLSSARTPATSSPPPESASHHAHANIKVARSDGVTHDLIRLAQGILEGKKDTPTALAPSTCRIVHFSDTHNLLRRQSRKTLLPEGDILIHSGGFTSNGTAEEMARFDRWLAAVSDIYKYRVVVPGLNDVKQCGNHLDFVKTHLPHATHVLCDSEETVLGIRIFGAAWHHHQHPQSISHRLSGTNILQPNRSHVDDHNRFDEIPAGIDILVSHGAAYGKLDYSDVRFCMPPDQHDYYNARRRGSFLGDGDPPMLNRKGSRELLKAIVRTKCGLHLHGMAAEARGVMYSHEIKEGESYPLTINSVMTDPLGEVLCNGPHIIQCTLHTGQQSGSPQHPAFSGDRLSQSTISVSFKPPPPPSASPSMQETGSAKSGQGQSSAWEFAIASFFN